MTDNEATCCVCGVKGVKGVTLVQIGGHELGSQAPDAKWYCRHMDNCLRRKAVRDRNIETARRKRV